MMRDVVTKISIALVIICLLLTSCGDVVTESPLTPVFGIPQLNFELDDFIGEKVWGWGYYGDSSISGRGYGFLVTDFDMLLVDEKLPDHRFILLDGELPGYAETGAEIMVYGEVKDFGETYDAFTLEPTPLITVEQHDVLSPSQVATISLDSPLNISFDGATPPGLSLAIEAYAEGGGKKATKDDRALILSGGIDAKYNYPRYKDNIKMAYEKLRHLDFNDEQIVVLYNDGVAINATVNNITTNIIDGNASKQTITQTLQKFESEMESGSTLVIFVTDHGTGYSPDYYYSGARRVLDPTRESGKTYAENTTDVDLRYKVYRANTYRSDTGVVWRFYMDKETNILQLDKREGDEWVLKGWDTDGDGRITETETGQDINGDGDKNDQGTSLADLGAWKHAANWWDTDGDGVIDVRAAWNTASSQYMIKRKVGNDWVKMGEDANGDFIIDGNDGGIDWNLDGDTDDQVSFHEGINLWGKEVLWDDELRDLLKPLYDKDICILVEMVSCFSGGFLENLKGVVEIVVAFIGEDAPHWNRWRWDAGGWCLYAADHEAFVNNLTAIDLASWETAFEAAKQADEAQWIAKGSVNEYRNEYVKWKTDAPKNCQPLVTFPDSFLDAIIRGIIGVVFDAPIYPSDLEGLTYLFASGTNIADLTGLGYCTNLVSLDLSSNQITDISPLAGLTSLTELSLCCGNQIIDISPLANLTNLTELNLCCGNQIIDISPLANLTSLTWLGLCCGNQISDISPLVQNEGLGTGDYIGLEWNPLSSDSVNIYIPELEARGATVNY